ncbi:uncharacterized protein LOC141857431, partial [Brevipalpus obovatus]|uniref:uncharacterized protein LOC141857431 n=1 Tax=Brevipalpus obovatus TaxID=246614 RepID=UPI003D9F2EA5
MVSTIHELDNLVSSQNQVIVSTSKVCCQLRCLDDRPQSGSDHLSPKRTRSQWFASSGRDFVHSKRKKERERERERE